MHISRRDLMLAATCWAGALEAQNRKERFVSFNEHDASEIEAIAERIIPESDTAGAKSAGVIFFIDRALAGYDKDKRELYRRGLAETEERRLKMFSASSRIADLSPNQQIELLTAIEKTEFFQQVRMHTILGFFGHPMHGGNRDMAGWKAIGMTHSMTHKPPFGYYDAEAARRASE